MRSRLGVVVLTPLLVLAVAACAAKKDSGIPTANGGTTTASPSAHGPLSEAQKQEQAVRFAQCMRAHGVTVQDPGPDHPAQIGGGAAGGSDPKAQAALDACKQYLPDGGDLPKPSTEQIEQLRAYAKCMREHGISTFPDPDSDGGLDIGKAGLKPDDPAFKQAEQACAAVRPSGGAVGGGGVGR